MKNILIAILIITGLSSCFKEDLDPVTGYNSALVLDKINFYNMPYGDSIIAQVSYLFLVTSDTAVSGVDTVTFNHSFAIQGLNSNQRIDFNTPENAQSATFNVRFRIYRGIADSVHVGNFSYKRDENTLISQPLYFNTRDSIFTTSALTVTF